MKPFFTLLIALFSFSASAQFGVLDNNFDADGIASVDIDGNWDLAYGVVQSADGKLLACGYTSDTGNDMIVFRLNPDGSADNSFGTNGLARIDFSNNDQAYCMALQADGKILLAGSSSGRTGNDFAVVRLLSDGSVDVSFGTNGLSIHEIGPSNDIIYEIEVQPDGKIVAAGITHDAQESDAALMRLNPDGSLDNTFSFDGKVITSIGDDDLVRGLALDPDGSVTIVGYSQTGIGDNEAMLIRYNADGSLDNNFGTNGILTADLGTGDDELYDITIEGSGKILVCGRSGSSSASDMLVAKFNPDGSIDNSFSFDGMVKTDFQGEYDQAIAMVVQPDSRILLAGAAEDGDAHFAMVRLSANGNLDNTFGTGGKVMTEIGDNSSIRDVIIQTDLKIVIAGYANDGDYDAVIARYTSGMNVGIGEVENYFGSTLVYPNPISNNQVTVEYELKQQESISIDLFDVTGILLGQLQPMLKEEPGAYQKTLYLPSVPAGTYLLRLNAEEGNVTIQLTVR